MSVSTQCGGHPVLVRDYIQTYQTSMASTYYRGSICEFIIYSPSLDSFQVCTSCASLARVHRLLIKQDAWIVHPSRACTPTPISQGVWDACQVPLWLSLYLPITFVCPVALLRLSLPKQDCNHRSVEPLAFLVCLDLTLQHHEAWIISPSLNQVSPPAVKLLVIHILPCGVKITTLNDEREKGSRPSEVCQGFSWWFPEVR